MNRSGSSTRGRLETVGGRPVLRFERTLRHRPDVIWRVVTDPAQMRHWFPAVVDTDLRVGAPMTFTFEGEAESYGVPPTTGEVLELDPPRVYAFRWVEDVLRFELLPDPEGCRLVFTCALGGDWRGRLGAGRDAAGWETCIDGLDAYLAGEPFEQPADWLARIEAYVEDFGLGRGQVQELPDGYAVRFDRDLMWTPVAQMWDLLTEGGTVAVGTTPPPARFRHGYVVAGTVRSADPPSTLVYDWLDDTGAAVGTVSWELAHDPTQGTRVALTQTVPDAHARALPTLLAAWHTHLELLFAAALGEVRCWPEGRVEELERLYRTSATAPRGR
jgi:uncharacterized protein YndB with AHSA1/START domain